MPVVQFGCRESGPPFLGPSFGVDAGEAQAYDRRSGVRGELIGEPERIGELKMASQNLVGELLIDGRSGGDTGDRAVVCEAMLGRTRRAHHQKAI
jgi:hypothetical protein